MAWSTPDNDKDDRLLDRRIVLLEGDIDDERSVRAIAKMLFLADWDHDTPITLWVDSPGGSVVCAAAIIDQMDQSTPPVHTRALSNVGGTAVWIVAHGRQGERSASLHSLFHLVPLLANKPTARAPEVLKRLSWDQATALARDTGRPPEQILTDMESGVVLTAEQAKDYGLVDLIQSDDD
jgi:ATP-dependent Clp protease protease subunit